MIVDISDDSYIHQALTMTARKQVGPSIARIKEYVGAMSYAGKAVEHVAMFADDYDAILKAAQKYAKAHSSPAITGLRYGSIPVNRGGKK